MICNKNIIYIFVYKAMFNSDNPPLFRCKLAILLRVNTIYVQHYEDAVSKQNAN